MKILKVISIFIFISFLAISCGSSGGGGNNNNSNDNNNDNQIPTTTADNDGDGYTENQGDCNDSDSGIYPGALDICNDGIDQDCNETDLTCSDTLIPINTVTTSSVREVLGSGDFVKLMNGNMWEVTLYKHRAHLWFFGNDILECNDELINLDKNNYVIATLIVGTSIACSASEKYYITEIYSNEIIKLNNGSMWEIDMFDKFDVFLWMINDDVLFTLPTNMMNINRREVVGVTQIK